MSRMQTRLLWTVFPDGSNQNNREHTHYASKSYQI